MISLQTGINTEKRVSLNVNLLGDRPGSVGTACVKQHYISPTSSLFLLVSSCISFSLLE